MKNISKEDLIKRLLYAKINNISTTIDTMKTIGIWSGFNYMTRHLLMKSLENDQIEDIRKAVRSGEIVDVDIIALIDDIEFLEAEAGQLLLVKDENAIEKSRQNAVKLLREIEGEITERSFWERCLRYFGLHRRAHKKDLLRNEKRYIH